MSKKESCILLSSARSSRLAKSSPKSPDQRCCNFFNFHADCTKFSIDIEHIILTNRAVFVFGTPKI
jgi:hypothetical protein